LIEILAIMNFYSTNNKETSVNLKEAVLHGLAKDRGLFMPGSIPVLPPSFFTNLSSKNFQDISFEVSSVLFGEDIPKHDLKILCLEAINFDTPLIRVHDNIYSLELFHGPTLAFKDIGARFMARMLQYFTKRNDREIHVLVATSGDTGSAVANGFLGVDGIKVHILYPKGLVSDIQEKQFTTLGENITALEVEGSFDDCQRLVKEAFINPEINEKLTLTSANSINIARLLPQSFYYFNGYRQLSDRSRRTVIAVPSGNFGNLTAGLIARRMGLPVSQFIASTNINDVVPEYLLTGEYHPRPSLATIANAMDVGDPSNFSRILDLYEYSHERISSDITAYSYTDDQIRKAITQVYEKNSYLMDPHGATSYMALKSFLDSNPDCIGIFLETAHPAKFSEIVGNCIGRKIEVPEKLAAFIDRKKLSRPMSWKFEDFKDYLMKLN
jgi:threonine synthase